MVKYCQYYAFIEWQDTNEGNNAVFRLLLFYESYNIPRNVRKMLQTGKSYVVANYPYTRTTVTHGRESTYIRGKISKVSCQRHCSAFYLFNRWMSYCKTYTFHNGIPCCFYCKTQAINYGIPGLFLIEIGI